MPVTAEDGSRLAVEVQRTIDDTPLKKGDIILAVNGVKIERRYDLMRQLSRSAVGTMVNLSISREDQRLDVSALARERQ